MFDDQVRNFQMLPISRAEPVLNGAHLQYEDCSFWDYLEEIKQITKFEEKLPEQFTRYAADKPVYPVVRFVV